jgi:hypothetical protein
MRSSDAGNSAVESVHDGRARAVRADHEVEAHPLVVDDQVGWLGVARGAAPSVEVVRLEGS